MNSQPPNPGSPEAIEAGCICPVLDNGHGHGYMGGMKDENGNLLFVTREDCPIHGRRKGDVALQGTARKS
jgi:hypothetical protein